MRELTFRGFLTQYVKQLAKQNTLNLSVLAAQAMHENPRLREPLILYAIFSGKQHTLYCMTVPVPYSELLVRYTAEEMTELLVTHSNALPTAFHKVWRSYQTRKNRLSADDHTKSLMRNKILRLQSAKHISNYRIYTDLKLNHGNINAWLKHGAAEKISLQSARRILHYVENCEARSA